MTGLPAGPTNHSATANLSCVFEANRLERSFWCSARMLTAKHGAAENTGQLAATLAMQTRISGGSSDTEVKEFAVKPRGVPSGCSVVTTVTPVAKAPRAWRKVRASIRDAGMVSILPFRQLRRFAGIADGCKKGPELTIHLARRGQRHHVPGVFKNRAASVGCGGCHRPGHRRARVAVVPAGHEQGRHGKPRPPPAVRHGGCGGPVVATRVADPGCGRGEGTDLR